jgi:nucleotide sugar dehydrogenase
MSKYKSFKELAKSMGRNIGQNDRPVVCVQGLGFVGTAMAIAVAKARDSEGLPYFNVIGVDLSTKEGISKIEAINNGKLPFKCNDSKLLEALKEAYSVGNLIATYDPEAFSMASVIVVDVHLNVSYDGEILKLESENFREAIRTIGRYIKTGCLVIIETTVPPGTCERIVVPELISAMKERGLPEDSFLLAHSYERVMPGKNYLDSIINFWRVYAGYTPEAADACEDFLSKVINVKSYPLTRLSSIRSSELGKILENSYRATTIAFMEEWGRFAEAIGVDLFEVIDAIRKRPTHSNIRTPGFGVGGYCLTKDPLLAKISAKDFFGLNNHFPFSTMAVSTNNAMPLVSLDKIQSMLGGSLKGKSILLLGVSYLQDIGDTRYSPSQIFVENARSRGAKVICHDPLIDYWPELNETLPSELPSPEGIDSVVFAVPHEEYKKLDIKKWLKGSKPLVLDAFNILSKQQREDFRQAGCKVICIGRGEGL